MITKVNPYGHISLTNDYFSGLVEQAAKQCYGIAAMGQAPAESVVRSACAPAACRRRASPSRRSRQAGHRPAYQGRFGLNISTITQKHHPPRQGRS